VVLARYPLRTMSVLSLKSGSVARPPGGWPIPAMAQQQRKRTQRQRLIAGMIEATNRRGYTNASIAAVIAHAGVSRPTFYDYFADRDACFHASILEVDSELRQAVEGTLKDVGGQTAWEAAVRAMVDYGASEPARARFLMGEAMAGGPVARAARDEGAQALAEAISAAVERSSDPAALVDLDPRVLVGSVYRMVSIRLRRGGLRREETVFRTLADELIGWLASYLRPAPSRRWATLQAAPEPPLSPHVPEAPLQRTPKDPASGRPRADAGEVTEQQRLRILYATGKLAETKGFAATTVTDIRKLARVHSSVFYRLFADKQEAFAAVHELGFQQVMDVTAKAFFSGVGWPERSWEGGRAFTQLLQENPVVAYIAFVEAYAVGPGAVQRIEDTHVAFLYFLEEGAAERGADDAPSRVAMEAIIAGIFEVIYMQARERGRAQIAAMFPYIAHIWLTPFLGVRQSDAFIDRKMKAAAPKRRARKR
jgi:AcrR family transcriptional regulator